MRNYLPTIEKGISWITGQMLTFDNGYYGIYERIRIDQHIRTSWSRPDCSAEFLRVLAAWKDLTGEGQHEELEEKLLSWLERTQDRQERSVWRGSFPFFRIDGYVQDTMEGEVIYANDNGKILIVLCQLYRRRPDPRYLELAQGLADYWIRAQKPDGTFGILDGKCVYQVSEGPCFLQWMMTGLYCLYEISGESRCLEAAEKSMARLLALILPNGRTRTTYELIGMENWRPASSETVISVYALAAAYRITQNPALPEPLRRSVGYLLSLQDSCGGIRNCRSQEEAYSQQDNPELCDLVYTAGFALQGLHFAYEALGGGSLAGKRLPAGGFPLLHPVPGGVPPCGTGGWRGSYHMGTRAWDGRADQSNPIDEGGMYSVYTGWCAANILYGLSPS